jgi:alcohol dehydrogenase
LIRERKTWFWIIGAAIVVGLFSLLFWGPVIGGLATVAAVALGVGDVVAVDGLESKRHQALELGATRALSPDELADALSRGDQGARADVVVEAAGNARAFEAAVAATAPGGRTVTVGLPHPDARAAISPLSLVAEARTVIGSYLGSAVPARDIPVFAQWWRDGRLPVEALVSSTIGLDDLNHAMDELAAGRAVRQVVEF